MKKLISTFLIGALVITSMSMFNSCKDYDNDIDDLQGQIDPLKTDLEAQKKNLADLQATVLGIKKTAEDALAKAEKNAEGITANSKAISDVKNLADANAAEIKKVSEIASGTQTVAEAARKLAEEAKTTAEKAQNASTSALDSATSVAKIAKAAAEAATKAQDAADGAAQVAKAANDTAVMALTQAVDAYNLANNNKADIAAALQRIAKLEQDMQVALGYKATIDSLSGSLDSISKIVSSNSDTILKNSKAIAKAQEDLKTLSKSVGSNKKIIDALYAGITSVELFGSYVGGAVEDEGSLDDMFHRIFKLMHGLVTTDSKFGDDETYVSSDPIVSFDKGDDISTEASFLIRVNPANADITNADIKLINSKGEVLEYVVAGTPTRFNGLITRGTIGTSLWRVPFKVIDGKNITEEDFNKATTANTLNGIKDILYAIAINNTPSDSTRYVLSTFDIDPKYVSYENTSVLDFNVDDKNVTEIHNRWTGDETSTEDAVKIDENIKEYTWANSTKDYPTPSVAMDEDHNVTPDDEDARYKQPLLPVEVGRMFTLKLTGADAAKIKNYYVALDKKAAIESTPSEWNAWKSYSYSGLFTTVSANKPLNITINSKEADGDIIGFRVFAVNYDGTLVDPDGRAFYVQVGEAANTESVAANDTITTVNAGITGAASLLEATGNTVIIPLSKNFAATSGNGFESNASGVLTLSDATKENLRNEQVYYQLLDKKKTATTDWSKAKFIILGVNNGGNWKDGSSLSGTIKATYTTTYPGSTTEVTRVVNTLNVTITKVLPTSNNTVLRFLPTQGNQTTGEFTLYMVPDLGWSANDQSETGTIDLDNTFYKLPDNIIFTFDKADFDDKGNLISKVTENQKTVYNAVEDPSDHVLYQLKKQFIDGKTAHDVAAAINYGKISSESEKDYAITLNQKLSAKFACWASANTYAWAKSKQPVITWKNSGEYASTNIAGDVVVKNSYDAQRFSGNLEVLITKNSYFTVKSTQLTWLDPTGKKQINPYLTPSYNNGTITWTRTQEENSVTADHEENLEITVVDCYGHEEMITLAVTIKKATN